MRVWAGGLARGPIHHHDDEGYQREHQIVEHGAPLDSTNGFNATRSDDCPGNRASTYDNVPL